MTTTTDIVNRALQTLGTRTTVTSAELLANSSNEAIQANLILGPSRDELLRMAPWDCAFNYNNLTFITSTPGTPENPSEGTSTWQKGIPAPPWAYEYQYPYDCLRAVFIVPQFTTGFASGVPITTAVTGGSSAFWLGSPQRYKVSIDQFFGATVVAVQAAGSGYAANDIITLEAPASGLGAPAQVKVLTVGGGGSIATCELVPITLNSDDDKVSGSYFTIPTNPIAQGSTTGAGTDATFNLTMQATQADQRVILTNQEMALLAYVKKVTDPNVMDPLFVQAWISYLGAKLVMALTGDKGLANMAIALANNAITEARKVDGNEGLTVNDVTPDWIRARGIYYPTWEISPNIQYDWGPLLTVY